MENEIKTSIAVAIQKKYNPLLLDPKDVLKDSNFDDLGIERYKTPDTAKTAAYAMKCNIDIRIPFVICIWKNEEFPEIDEIVKDINKLCKDKKTDDGVNGAVIEYFSEPNYSNFGMNLREKMAHNGFPELKR